ncbi:MAG: hypothetical protein V5A66_02945 [Candidatus Thermoplasmatota archaeon]
MREYGSKTEIDAIALTSKNGIPIASHLENEKENESFSTLSATILGAGEVIFSGLEKENPEVIVGHSANSLLLIKGVDTDMALSLLGDSDKEEKLKKDMDELVSKMNELSETFEIEGV